MAGFVCIEICEVANSVVSSCKLVNAKWIRASFSLPWYSARGQRYFDGSFQQIWQRELMARSESAWTSFEKPAKEYWSQIFGGFLMWEAWRHKRTEICPWPHPLLHPFDAAFTSTHPERGWVQGERRWVEGRPNGNLLPRNPYASRSKLKIASLYFW